MPAVRAMMRMPEALGWEKSYRAAHCGLRLDSRDTRRARCLGIRRCNARKADERGQRRTFVAAFVLVDWTMISWLRPALP